MFLELGNCLARRLGRHTLRGGGSAKAAEFHGLGESLDGAQLVGPHGLLLKRRSAATDRAANYQQWVATDASPPALLS
jgi:hypothetical protein